MKFSGHDTSGIRREMREDKLQERREERLSLLDNKSVANYTRAPVNSLCSTPKYGSSTVVDTIAATRCFSRKLAKVYLFPKPVEVELTPTPAWIREEVTRDLK